MKRVLLWLGAGLGVVVLSVSAVLAYVVFVLDPNDYKQELADVVKQKTDMDLALKGDLAWQLWPSIGIRLGETSLTDPVLKETLAEVKQAAVSVELLPLLSGRASIDAVLVDGAAVRFVQYADGRTSWDRLLEKLKSPDEEEQSEQVAFDIEKLDVSNARVTLIDEAAGVTRAVENVFVRATGIDPDAEFPLEAGFRFSQKDADGKTVVADNTVSARVKLGLEAQKHVLSALALDSQLSGSLLPAPAGIALKAGTVTADLAAQRHQVDGLQLDVEYRDPALKQPATLKLTGGADADLAKQTVALPGLVLAASYQDKGRPAPVEATVKTDIAVDLAKGQASLKAIDVQGTLADASLPKPLPLSLKTALEANWKTGDIDLRALVAQLAGIRLDGQVAVKLPALASGAEPVTKGMSVSGGIQTGSFDPRQVMAALGIEAPKTKDANVLRRASLSAQLAGDEHQVLARNLRLVLDGSTVTGEAGVRELPKARLYARLALDKLNADSYLPPDTAAEQGAGKAGDKAAAKPDAKAAAEGLLPVALLREQNLDVALQAGALTIMTYPITQLRVAATARDGLVDVSELRGSIYDGSFSVPVSIDARGKQPVISLKPDIRQIDLGPIAKQTLKQDVFAGRMNFNGAVKVTGNDVDTWLKTAQGPNTLRLDNGVIKGVNISDALFNALGQYQALLPALTGRDAASIKGKISNTEIESLLGEMTLDRGVVRNQSMKADLKDIQVGGNGTYNLETQDVDYRFQLKLDKKYWGEKYAKMAEYAIPVRCNGNLKGSVATLCGLDKEGMQGIVGQVAKARLNEEVDKEKAKLQEKLNEKLGDKLNSQQQEAVKQLFDVFKKR